MILETNKNKDIIKSEGLETSVVEVNTSPESVKILTENLYSDVPLAVVRELSANAIDANRDANNRLNDFIIHVPSKKEPYFSIEDHGTGMSKEKVMHVFKDFFKSTRDKDNDHAGMYGLGAKTPLAYTRNFSIVSSFNGESNAYIETWEDDKLPEVSLIPNTTKSSNITGTKITVPVKEEDIYDFNTAIVKTCAFFPGVPSFENLEDNSSFNYYKQSSHKNDEFTMTTEILEKINQDFKKSNVNPWVAFSGKRVVLYERIYVEMGNVGYPVDKADLFEPDSAFGTFYESLRDFVNVIVIHANIGDVDVLPSRENLKLSKKTINYIKSWFVSFIADQYKNLDDINARIKFYATNNFMKFIDFIYENKDLLFEGKKNDFINFYNTYKNDKRLISEIFKDGKSVLTFTPYGEINSKNELLPYPYINDLANEYITYAKSSLRVIVNTPEVAKHLKSTSLSNISGTYVRSHIMGLKDYKNYIYLFTSPLTLKKLTDAGISYSEVRNFIEISPKPKDYWADKKIFEVSYRTKDIKSGYVTPVSLWSWNDVRKLANSYNLTVYFLIKNKDGQFAPYDNNVNSNTDIVLVHKRFDVSCDSIIRDPLTGKNKECIVVSGSITNIIKASKNAEGINVNNYVNDVKGIMRSTLEEINSLPYIESNNIIKLIREIGWNYVNYYNWPEKSVFKKLFDTFKYGEGTEEKRKDKMDWLEYGGGIAYRRVFLRLSVNGNEDLKELYDKVYTTRSILAQEMKSYPLIKLGLLDGYSDEYGFQKSTTKEKTVEYVKFLIDYFAMVDGAKLK